MSLDYCKKWLDYGLDMGFIKGWEYDFVDNRFTVRDNNNDYHVIPESHTKLHSDLAFWLFALYLKTDYPAAHNAPQSVRTAPVYATKDEEIAAINHELDIYRGVIPTPPGYKADKGRVKQLMQRLKELTR